MPHIIPAVIAGLLAAACMQAPAHAQPASASPEAVVRAYADAANRHDLDGFLALYAPDIRKYRFPAEFRGEGLQRYREAYAKSFAANPELKVEILDLFVLGDKVVSYDRVTGLAGGRIADEVTVYEVRDGKIVNIVAVERRVR